MGQKTYTVTIEVDVSVKDNGLVVQRTDSVEAAVRHMLRTLIPPGWRKNGVLFHTMSIHTEAKEKEVVTNV